MRGEEQVMGAVELFSLVPSPNLPSPNRWPRFQARKFLDGTLDGTGESEGRREREREREQRQRKDRDIVEPRH
jgi:hypothetical protein